jgi:Putative transposase, YhgA-like
MAKKTKPNQEIDEENLHHPNDKSFKTVMQVKESALEYMEKFAPKLYAHLDLSSFELDTTNYVNKDFDEFYSDVVYQTYLRFARFIPAYSRRIAAIFTKSKALYLKCA